MPDGPVVVVVGAGALGLCTAYELLALGVRDVTVLEKGTVAGASSGLAVGIIETQYLDPLPIAIRVYSMGFFGELEREDGLEITRNGYLRLAHDPSEVERFERSVGLQAALGVRDATVLDAAAIRRLIPDLDPEGIAAGLFGPSDGYVDPARYCSLVADRVRARGGSILVNTELTGVDDLPDGRHRLRTSGGSVDCDVVVNAAGGWAGRVGDLLGAPALALPQRHQALFARLARPLPYVMPSVMDYVPGTGRHGLYFRHDTVSSLVAGLHSEDLLKDIVDPDRYRRGGDDDRYMAAVGEQLEARLPGLGEVRLGGVWAGIYPISPDGEPSLGPYAARPTVFAALGGGGAGLQSSPGIGRIVAEQIVHGASRTVPGAEALSPDRASLRAHDAQSSPSQ